MTFKYLNYKCVFFIFFIGVKLCTQSYVKNKHNNTNYYFLQNRTNRNQNLYLTTTTKYTTAVNKLNIKLYYETLCPASVRFFSRQLKPVVEKLASYVNIELVPYGHARTLKIRNHYKFRCQHGPDECYGNMLHACAVDAIQNNTQAILFNACLMQYSPYYRSNFGFDYVSILNWCGYKLNVLINGVWECVNSIRGSILLKNYGDETHALKLQYVPYLVLNGSVEYEDSGLESLMSTVCRMLHPSPPPCYSYP